jgi:hypothetical protein
MVVPLTKRVEADEPALVLTPPAAGLTDLPDVVPSGGAVEVPLESVGPAEEQPRMLLVVMVTDAATEQPMETDVYLTVGEEEREPVFADLLGMGVHWVEATLPGELVGWLVVKAAGYDPLAGGEQPDDGGAGAGAAGGVWCVVVLTN